MKVGDVVRFVRWNNKELEDLASEHNLGLTPGDVGVVCDIYPSVDQSVLLKYPIEVQFFRFPQRNHNMAENELELIG